VRSISGKQRTFTEPRDNPLSIIIVLEPKIQLGAFTRQFVSSTSEIAYSYCPGKTIWLSWESILVAAGIRFYSYRDPL
jgi:hypothetical protein